MGEVLTEVEEDNVFHVVTSPWKPYTYEEGGEYKGIAYDSLDFIMDRLEVEYNFEIEPWSRALKMVEAGEADALLSAAYSPDREAYLAYTPEQLAYGKEGVVPSAYLHTTNGIFLVKTLLKDNFVFESIEQVVLDGHLVGVTQGYGYAANVDEANCDKISHVTEQESLNVLLNEEIDMFLTYREVGLAIRNGVNTRTICTGIRLFFPN